MRCCRIALALMVLGGSAYAGPLAVDVVDASTPTDCAETDNVYVKFISGQVRSFTIEAVHPRYIWEILADNKEPDFTNCRMKPSEDYRFKPRQVTLYDSGNWKLLGFTYPNFWRPNQVPVRVGDKTENGLHLLQLWTRGRQRDEEVLVLYPADGYWRARPLAPNDLSWKIDPLLPTAYGTSFMVGPIEQKGRPLVDITAVTFDPDASSFRLTFKRGGTATLRVGTLTQAHTPIEVSFDRPMLLKQFAALRSMFVEPDNSDAAVARWTSATGEPGGSEILRFSNHRVTEFRLGRTNPSRHNTSAPDMILKDFRE